MTIRLADSDRSSTVEHCTHDYQVSCGNCRLSSICLPFALESEDIEQLDNIVQRSKPIQKDQHLYREGDNFESVFAVRSGTLKAYKTTDDGKEQVTGFYFPGEILRPNIVSPVMINSVFKSSPKSVELILLC